MDFVADRLANGRKIRTLTIVDLYTRECLGIEAGFTLRAEDVVTAMNHLKYDRGLPKRIACDNGSEFAGGRMDLWAYANKVTIDFSRRGKPTDNEIVESFNGRFREECLNTQWFESLEDAKEKIDGWRWDYNERRPHRSLQGLTPTTQRRRLGFRRAWYRSMERSTARLNTIRSPLIQTPAVKTGVPTRNFPPGPSRAIGASRFSMEKLSRAMAQTTRPHHH
jgi:putative transposase